MKEKIFISFAFKEDEDISKDYILIVPDLGSLATVSARNRSTISAKAVKNIKKVFKPEKLDNIVTHSHGHFTKSILEEFGIPDNATMIPLIVSIKDNKKKSKDYKVVSASINISLNNKIEKYIKDNDMSKSEFISKASKKFLE